MSNLKSLNIKSLNLQINSNKMKNTNKRYEAPQAEVIVIEMQGVLCASGGTPTPGLKGNGIQFDTQGGSW